jgi:predicted DCC family thiol-disulfide oxidoreductase YuxK
VTETQQRAESIMTDRKEKEKPKKAVLIYDGNCPVCGKTVAWIKDNAKRGAFEMLPCQAVSIKKRFPSITRAVCMQAMQLVLPDGTVLSGEKALPEVLKRLRRYSSAAALFKLPGSETLSRAFYRWFADRRYHIAGLLFPGEGKRSQKSRKNTTSSFQRDQ